MTKNHRSEFIAVTQGAKRFFLCKLPAGVLTTVSYAAVRRVTDEEGAVQRVLNSRRIEAIKQFVLKGGYFPSSMVLNWATLSNHLKIEGNSLSFAVKEKSAQIIDGQHRIAGIREAIESNESIAKIQIPVAIYQNLSTRECADLFLSINTEQKPVDRSLVYDLYDVASEDMIDQAADRARDIAMFLHDEEDSPYVSNIKLPGSAKRRGGIALSTVVSAIKPLVEDKGVFELVDVTSLEAQKRIIMNLFLTLEHIYGEQWWDTSNAFMYAAGFLGAIDFLRLKLIEYCNGKRSYAVKTMSEVMKLQNLILQKELKNMSGKEAARTVYDRLLDGFIPKSKKGTVEIEL